MLKKVLTVFEYQRIRVGDRCGDYVFTEEVRKSLEGYYGSSGVPYFDLIHRGVRFSSFVGVIQIGSTLIEVLPKVDVRNQAQDNLYWRDLLVRMLGYVGSFDVRQSGSGHLKLKPNAILDLYFELFIQEVEYLLHAGLVKKYHHIHSNQKSLKGALHFSKHLTQNLVRKDRFFVHHTTYDQNHLLHQILYETILLIDTLTNHGQLQSRLQNILLNFPEVGKLKINSAIFSRVKLNRKTEGYKKALHIAELLHLRYHPDVSQGKNHVLALMFDMNVLWEEFIFKTLRRNLTNWKVTAQTGKTFWKRYGGKVSSMKPDIILKNENQCIVLDTKWKNLQDKNPSPEDLRQMFVYQEYFHAEQVGLVYPGNQGTISGFYMDPEGIPTSRRCSIIRIEPNRSMNQWQETIVQEVQQLIETANPASLKPIIPLG